MFETNTCCELQSYLDKHLPTCQQCRDAHKWATAKVLQPDKIVFPCTPATDFMNSHREGCDQCNAQLDQRVKSFAKLLRGTDNQIQ